MTANQTDPRAAARFDFLLRFHAKDAGLAWLSSLTTWGWRQGIELAAAMAPGNPDNVAGADDVLKAAEAIGVLRRGNVQLSHTTAAFFNYRQGGYWSGNSDNVNRKASRAPKKLIPALMRETDYCWQLTELGEAYFKWLAAQTK